MTTTDSDSHESTVQLLIEGSSPFRDSLAEFIYYRTYSRWQDDLGRRETWGETVDRATEFLFDKAGEALTADERRAIATSIYNHESLPSMRLLWSAGTAAARNNIAIFNCSYAAVDDLRVFDEALFILMSGTGFGFSVESENTEDLPKIKKQKKLPPVPFTVPDSRYGWAESVRMLFETLYQGGDVAFDYSELRAAGVRLMTMGGRSSGPEPLKRLHDFIRAKVKSREGRRLRPIDAHDIMCMIGEVVVAGGVRRSSLISLSDLDDTQMRGAKFGAFYNQHPYRSMSNNSVAYNEKPSAQEFMDEYVSLVKSGSGERGIFNRESVFSTSPRRKKMNGMGTNPCAEILLRNKQFCNLTSVVARPEDTLETLIAKTRIASIVGTIQSTFTDFTYLRPEWKQNCDEERLLGVSLSGQMDSPVAQDPKTQEILRKVAIETNIVYAQRLGINPSAAVTAVKPEGTSSKMVKSGSGLHVWWSKFFKQNVRISATDPLFVMLKTYGVPHEPEVGQDPATASTWVVMFPRKAPEGAKTRHDVTALDQLEYWKSVKLNYTEHNPSVTIYVKEDEWPRVLAWVFDNWAIVGGISFLPSDDHVYRLAPYEEITEDEYNALMATFPTIDYSFLSEFEKDDNTTGARDFACVGGSCDIV